MAGDSELTETVDSLSASPAPHEVASPFSAAVRLLAHDLRAERAELEEEKAHLRTLEAELEEVMTAGGPHLEFEKRQLRQRLRQSAAHEREERARMASQIAALTEEVSGQARAHAHLSSEVQKLSRQLEMARVHASTLCAHIDCLREEAAGAQTNLLGLILKLNLTTVQRDEARHELEEAAQVRASVVNAVRDGLRVLKDQVSL
jgi:chromosome segregation ATPase